MLQLLNLQTLLVFFLLVSNVWTSICYRNCVGNLSWLRMRRLSMSSTYWRQPDTPLAWSVWGGMSPHIGFFNSIVCRYYSVFKMLMLHQCSIIRHWISLESYWNLGFFIVQLQAQLCINCIKFACSSVSKMMPHKLLYKASVTWFYFQVTFGKLCTKCSVYGGKYLQNLQISSTVFYGL